MSQESTAASAVRGLFGRDALYLVLWAVQLLIAALFTPVTTRVLGAGRFGFVASCVAVMQVLFAVAGLSLQTAVQRQYAATGERDARRLVALAAGLALLVFVVANATGPAWSRALGLGDYPAPVQFAVVWACCTAVSNAALGLLRSRDQLRAFATVSLIQSVIAEGLGLLFVLAIRKSASEYMLGQLVAQAIAVALALAVTRPLPLRLHDIPMLSAAMRYAIPLVPGALAVFVLESSDRLVLQHHIGSAAVARYSVAYNIGSIPILLFGVLNNVWMPRVFALSDAGTRRSVLAHSRDALYALLIPVIIGLGVGAPILLHIWAPPSYHPDGLLVVVAIIVCTAIPCAGAMSHTRTLLADGRTLPAAVATIGAAVANIVLNLALVPALGITGSALATFLSYLALQVLLGMFAHRVLPLPHVSRMLTAELALTVGLAFITTQVPVSIPFLVIRGVLALASGAIFATMLASLIRTPRHRPNAIAGWLQSRLRLAAV
ncbi:MAG: oligosaccharide flippase family protein [Solirubrobacteraceae bacterium]